MTNPQQFYERSKAWFDRFLELQPIAATRWGDHRFDGELGGFTQADQDAYIQELRSMFAEVDAMDVSEWPNDAQIDHRVMRQTFRRFIREFEVERNHVRDPGYYLMTACTGLLVLLLNDFAPLPERLQSALSRTRQVPRVLREGRELLDPQQVPPVWAQSAMEAGGLAPLLFQMLLPNMARAAAPEIAEEMAAACEEASQAVEEHLGFLRDEILPHAQGEFAVGRERFDELLREDHMVDYDAARLLEIGWEQFELTKQKMEAVAAEIDPARSAKEILKEAKNEHPTAEGLLKAYEDAMASARQYVIDHEIATIPGGETLKIMETPGFLRPLVPFAAYYAPGVLESKQEGVFLVTPVDPNMPEEVREQKLRGHPNVKLPLVALHEAYPGHHLQAVWANRVSTLPRKLGLFLATMFCEGWAFYCEELMETLGWIDQPIQRLSRLRDELWRAARIILDVSLHTKGMTIDEAIDFMVENVQLEPENARAEVWRYAQSATQPQSYLMGKLQILDLIDDLKKAHPDLSMKALHDKLLGVGSLPPRLMRQALEL